MVSDLRPLTLGELLDRTFSLYRKNFLLFIGIIALPHLLLLAFQLAGVVFRTGTSAGLQAAAIFWSLGTVVVQLGVVARAVAAVAVSRRTSPP